jgi:hypothetical protein
VRIDEAQVGLFIGAIQANDQLEGVWSFHGVGVWVAGMVSRRLDLATPI